MPLKPVSLQTAKMLKESGFRQDSPFNWVEYSSEFMPKVCFAEYGIDNIRHIKICSAPTTDELLEEIPYALRYDDADYWFQIQKLKHESYDVRYSDWQHMKVKKMFQDESLPEALAQMWLYLKKENLL